MSNSFADIWCLRGRDAVIASARLANRGALGLDAAYQVLPGRDKGRGAFVLKPGRQRVDVDARLGEAGQHRLAVAAVRRERPADRAMIAERLERALRHGVDRKG